MRASKDSDAVPIRPARRQASQVIRIIHRYVYIIYKRIVHRAMVLARPPGAPGIFDLSGRRPARSGTAPVDRPTSPEGRQQLLEFRIEAGGLREVVHAGPGVAVVPVQRRRQRPR
ncbi:hypothetical protein ACE1SV_42470 [Streptomyces sennicomposti]